MNRRLFSALLLSTLCAACGSTPPAAMSVPPAMAAARLDAAVAEHLGSDFNGVVLVRSGGRAPQVRAYGMARAAPRTAAAVDTRYQIGSISKWLTAVTVLRLVDQGKLALDIPIATYLPEMPAHSAAVVTLRHLLSNTAGIPNGVMQEFKKDPSIADLPLSHLQASLRFGAGKPAFAPGSAWDYSPTTWTVVAAIIERVSGRPYADVVAQLVLAPAAAGATAVPRTPFRDLPGAAWAYRNKQPWELKMPPHVVFVAASGTLYSTAGDLAQLAHTVYETPLLSASALSELSRIQVADQNYALGGRVRALALGGTSRKVAWETGASGAFKTLLAYVPGEGTTVVILNNTDMAQDVIGKAGEALLGSLYTTAAAH